MNWLLLSLAVSLIVVLFAIVDSDIRRTFREARRRDRLHQERLSRSVEDVAWEFGRDAVFADAVRLSFCRADAATVAGLLAVNDEALRTAFSSPLEVVQ